MIYNLCWQHEGPGRIWLVGPFVDNLAACDWGESRETNPSDNPCWQVIDLDGPLTRSFTLAVVGPQSLGGRLP